MANNNTASSGYYMFSDLKSARDITKYTLFRGTTDWTQLEQFDMYESGYNYLVCVSIPKFLQLMAEKDTGTGTMSNTDENGVKHEIATNGSVDSLVKNYKHIVERDFLGLDSGLDDLSVETQDISNGAQSINVITKVNAPSATNFSMTYRERSGSPITKLHEMYLRCVKDPATTFKTYNGLIGFEDGKFDPSQVGFHKECFSYLYMATDNTGLLLEKAIYFVCCQPQSAQWSIYGGQHGSPEFQSVTVEYSGLPLVGAQIDAQAKRILNWMNNKANENYVYRNSWNYNYEGISDSANGLMQASLTGDSIKK